MFKKIFKIFPKQHYPVFFLLLILFVIGGFLETLGIGLFIPLLNNFAGNSNLSLPIIDKIVFIILDKITIVNFEISILIFLGSVFILKNLIILQTLRIQNKFVQDVFLTQSDNLLRKYLSQNYAFHTKKNSSTIIRNLGTELFTYRSTLLEFLTFISKTIVVIGILILLLTLNFYGSLFSILIFISIYFIFSYFTKIKIVEWGKKRHFYSSEWIKCLQQAISSITIIKIFSVEKYFISKYKDAVRNLTFASRNHDNVQGYPRVFLEIIIIFFFLAIFIYFVNSGYSFSSIFTLISFYFVSILRIAPPLLLLNKCMISFQFSKKSIFDLTKEFSLKEIFIEDGPPLEIKFNHSIVLKNLSFKYSKSKDKILNNINLKFKKNEFIGIVGASGAGKTTLVNIILGLVNPDTGKILIDNCEINNQNPNWIKKISYVPQITYLLDSSIKENVAFGKFKKEIDNSKIKRLIKITQLKSFVNKSPKKLNSNVGERGSKISEGQKQRIGVARALYKDAEILVLDEITSSLDKFTEKKLMDDVSALKGKKTIFFISHKKDILKNCDKIIEIKNGKIKIIKNV